MDRSLTLTGPGRLAAPPLPQANPIDALLTQSGLAFMTLFEASRAQLPAGLLAAAVADAEAFLGSCGARASRLREAAEIVADDELTAALMRFVGAWPNASHGDLAAYGAQLAQDVLDRRPCRYALDEALRQLRQTSRFLPSIAEVLAVLDAAQARVRNTQWHVEQIETLLAMSRSGAHAPSPGENGNE